ncbi:hypothetical protein [Solidesulfovibrio sp. C21]|uniref:hypothetical protein n=1 Tax=Solidesulfovibrio sp. C21 TaxID=3398613 RepID=UPI0039FBF294
MYGHHAFFYGGGQFLWQILLIVVVIAAIAALRRRRDRVERAGRDADTEAVALLEEVRSTLSRLEDRVRNLETLMERDADKRGKS